MKDKAVSKSEFARIYGVSAPYVSKLNQQGRLVKNAKDLILVEASIAKIAESGDLTKVKRIDTEILPEPDTKAQPSDSARYKRAQAKEKEAMAELRQLEYGKRMGEMVLRDDVAKEISKAIKIARNKLFAMPSNLAPRLAAQTDEKTIFAILMNEAENVITELQQGLAAYRGEESGI